MEWSIQFRAEWAIRSGVVGRGRLRGVGGGERERCRIYLVLVPFCLIPSFHEVNKFVHHAFLPCLTIGLEVMEPGEHGLKPLKLRSPKKSFFSLGTFINATESWPTCPPIGNKEHTSNILLPPSISCFSSNASVLLSPLCFT